MNTDLFTFPGNATPVDPGNQHRLEWQPDEKKDFDDGVRADAMGHRIYIRRENRNEERNQEPSGNAPSSRNEDPNAAKDFSHSADLNQADGPGQEWGHDRLIKTR